MTEMRARPQKLVPIKVQDLRDNTSTHFDIYDSIGSETINSDSVILCAKSPYNWSLRELTDLTRVGLQDFFVADEDHSKYERYVKLNAEIPKFDPKSSKLTANQFVSDHFDRRISVFLRSTLKNDLKFH